MADDKPVMGEQKTEPPQGNDDVDRMREALHKANEEAKKYRLQVQDRDRELEQLKAAGDASKSEMDKVHQRIAELEKQATDAEAKVLRAEVSQAKGLSPAQAKRLAGSTREELEADADELLEAFRPTSMDNSDTDHGDVTAGSTRPKETLRPGASPDPEQNTTGTELAEQVWKRTRGEN